MWVFVDVDGTLIDNWDNPRPYVWEFFHYLKSELGCHVVVWSAGGQDYAERKIGMIGRKIERDLETFVDEYLWKLDYWDKVKTDEPQFFIDDVGGLIARALKEGHNGFKVPFYNDPADKENDPEKDKWLLKAAWAVEECINERGSEATSGSDGKES